MSHLKFLVLLLVLQSFHSVITSGFSVDFGFLNFSQSGLEVKPQFLFGAAGDHFDFGVGIGDVREGLTVRAEAVVQKKFYGSGDSLEEFLEDLSTANGVGKDVIQPFILGVGNTIGQVVEFTGVDVSNLQISGTLTVFGGVGVGASLGLGVEDPDGYRKFGAWACIGNFEAAVLAGKHKSDGSVKVTVIVPYAMIEFIALNKLTA